jgi:pilus assembly protein CpaE
VLDCDGDPAAVKAAYLRLHNGHPVPTLLLFGDELPSFAPTTDGMNDEYVRKPTPAEALTFRIQAMLIRSGRQVSASWASEDASESPVVGEGHIIAVFAPKGGVGKTTVAVNLAAALREQTHGTVLLLDADVGVGDVTSVLAVPERPGLADLAGDEWSDSAFVHAATSHERTGIDVLSWGTDPVQAELVPADLLIAAVGWARRHYNYVVIDTHPDYDDRTMAMLTLAHEIILVVTPEVGPVKNSAQFLALAREVGLIENVRVVVNRANHGIRMSQMAEALGIPVSATIVSNGMKAVIASNEGVPIVLKYPNEKITSDLHAVARLITQPKAALAANGRQSRRPWWTKIGLRTSSSGAGR